MYIINTVMKHSIHYCLSLKSQAQDLGFRPTSWSTVEMTSDDRTPEIQIGFLEGAGYA
jgi:hypothetical protein